MRYRAVETFDSPPLHSFLCPQAIHTTSQKFTSAFQIPLSTKQITKIKKENPQVNPMPIKPLSYRWLPFAFLLCLTSQQNTKQNLN